MTNTPLVRLINLLLITAILHGQSFAQFSAPAFNKQTSADLQVNLVFATIPNTTPQNQFKDINQYKAYKAAIVADELALRQAAAAIKKEYCYDARRGAGTKDTCLNGQCFDAITFNQALLRILLVQATGSDSKHPQFKDNMEIMAAHAKDIYFTLQNHGAAPADTPILQNYLTAIVEHTQKLCDNDTYLADIMPGLASVDDRLNARKGKEARAQACQSAAYAMLAMPLLDITPLQHTVNATLIYEQLKNSYRKDYGAIILSPAIAALMAIGNTQAYGYIEKFLLHDSLADGLQKGSIWQMLGKALDVFSIKAWVDKFTNANNKLRGRGGRFLNNAGLRLQYIDKEAAIEMGFEDWQVHNANAGAVGYNMPYRTVWEDIGFMLSAAQNTHANKIAQKAVSNYSLGLRQGNAYNTVHAPLALGALTGKHISYFDAGYAVQNLYNLDWWDLNEGTQRRINNQAAKIAKNYNLSILRVKTLDETKKIRGEQNARIGELAVWADMLAGAVFATMLIASLPAISKNISSFITNAQRVRAINSAGKAALLKTISTNIKMAPMTAKATAIAPAKQAAQNIKTMQKTQPMSISQSTNAKLSAADFVPMKDARGTNSLVYKWTAQQHLAEAKNTNFTTQVGGMGGGGATAKTMPNITPKAVPQPISGYHGPAKAYTPRPAIAPKNIPTWKLFLMKQQLNIGFVFDNMAQIIKLGVKKPSFLITGAVLPAGTTIQQAMPFAIYSAIPKNLTTTATLVFNLNKTAIATTSLAKTATTTTAAAQALKTARAISGSANTMAIAALPQITGVLNQWHGGASASIRSIKPNNYMPIQTDDYSASGTLASVIPLQQALADNKQKITNYIADYIKETQNSVNAYLVYKTLKQPVNMPYQYYAKSITDGYVLLSHKKTLIDPDFYEQQRTILDNLMGRLSPDVAMYRLLGNKKQLTMEQLAQHAKEIHRQTAQVNILSGKTYIVLDDGPRPEIAQALNPYSTMIYPTASIKDAINYVTAHANDDIVVLTDILLSDSHGMQVMEQVKEINPDIPVVSIGKQTQDEVALLSTLGFTGGIPLAEEPFTPQLLAQILQNAQDKKYLTTTINTDILNDKYYIIADDGPRNEVVTEMQKYSKYVYFMNDTQNILDYIKYNMDKNVILLTDFFLKGTNAIALLEKARAIKPEIPVVVIGHQRRNDIALLGQYGFTGAIPTASVPFSGQELAIILNKAQNPTKAIISKYTFQEILQQFDGIIYGSFVDFLGFLNTKAVDLNLEGAFLTVLHRTLTKVKEDNLTGKQFSAMFWQVWDQESLKLAKQTGIKIPISPSSIHPQK